MHSFLRDDDQDSSKRNLASINRNNSNNIYSNDDTATDTLWIKLMDGKWSICIEKCMENKNKDEVELYYFLEDFGDLYIDQFLMNGINNIKTLLNLKEHEINKLNMKLAHKRYIIHKIQTFDTISKYRKKERNTKCLKEWIEISIRHKQWSILSQFIQSNHRLKSVKFNVDNISFSEHKLCELFVCIQQNTANLNSLELSFGRNIEIKDYNMLHQRLIDCILSKCSELQFFSLTANVLAILNEMSPKQVLVSKLSNLQKLIIHIPETFVSLKLRRDLCVFIEFGKELKEVTINANDSILEPYKVINLIETFTYHIKRMYDYYQSFRYSLFTEPVLNVFDNKTKAIIFAFCQLDKYEARIHSKQPINTDHIFSFEINIVMEIFEITEIAEIDRKLKEIKDVIALNGNVNIYINDYLVFSSLSRKYHHHLFSFELLLFGFIHTFDSNFPLDICRLISNYYPSYDVFSVNFDSVHSTELQCKKWEYSSSVLDNTNIILCDDKIGFKTIDSTSIWCSSTFKSDDLLDNLLPSASYLSTYGRLADILMKDTKEQYKYTELIRENNIKSNIIYFWPKVYNNINKQRIVNIQTGWQHALFLTLNGNVFIYSFSKNVGMQQIEKLSGIKTIVAGTSYNWCIDGKNKVYYFGRNENNIFGIDDINESTIDSPTIHPYFSEKNVLNIYASDDRCIFIDALGHCYVTGIIDKFTENNILNVNHMIGDVFFVVGLDLKSINDWSFCVADNEKHLFFISDKHGIQRINMQQNIVNIHLMRYGYNMAPEKYMWKHRLILVCYKKELAPSPHYDN